MKRFSPYFILLLFVALFSCEYKFSDDHYAEIEKPPKEIPITIDLNGVSEDQNIYIYKTTRLRYRVDAGIRPLLFVGFQLDGYNLSYREDEIGYFVDLYYSYGANMQPAKLALIIEVSSNSGSLADKLMSERYNVNMEFTVNYLPPPTIDLNIKQEKSPEGYLQLSWDNPVVPHAEVDYYTISRFSDGGEVISPNNPIFIDKEYYYGYKQYFIRVHFKEDKLEPVYLYYSVFYEFDPELTYEFIEKGKVKISWNPNEYNNCKYVFVSDEGEVIETKEPFVIANYPPFPSDFLRFNIYLLGDNENYDETKPYSHWIYGYAHVFFSTLTDWPQYPYSDSFLFYDLSKKISIHTDGYNASFYDFGNLSFIKKTTIRSRPESSLYVQEKTCSQSTGKIAINYIRTETCIYADDSFRNPVIIPDERKVSGLTLTDNNLLCCVYDDDHDNYELVVYNASSGDLIFSSQLPEINRNISNILFSNDGKYFVYVAGTELHCYQLEETSIKKLYQERMEEHSTVLFNPLNPGEIISYKHYPEAKFHIIDVSDFSLKKTIEGIFGNIDRVSGKLAYTTPLQNYTSRYRLTILEPETYEIFGETTVVNSPIYLLDNNMFCNWTYTSINNFFE